MPLEVPELLKSCEVPETVGPEGPEESPKAISGLRPQAQVTPREEPLWTFMALRDPSSPLLMKPSHPAAWPNGTAP